MDEKLVLGVGELLWDCFSATRRPGGAPANVAFHVGQLGDKGIICSRVGCDALGEELLKCLGQRGLDTTCVQRDQEYPTGTVIVDAARADDPVYTIQENVAWDHLEFTDQLAQLAAAASAVCLGTLAQRAPSSRETVDRVLAGARDALIVYDVNLRPPWYSTETVGRLLANCDVVKLNSEEVLGVASMLSFVSNEPTRFADEVFERFDVRLVCMTRAGEGVLAISPQERFDLPGQQVVVADAVGAGDAFTAAMIHGLLHGRSLEQTIRFANRVGGLVASRAGAMPELREEYARLEAEA